MFDLVVVSEAADVWETSELLIWQQNHLMHTRCWSHDEKLHHVTLHHLWAVML